MNMDLRSVKGKELKNGNENIKSILTESVFLDKKVDLNKYKILKLKEILKKNKLPISGKKSVLISRINTFFAETENATIIQKNVRGHFIRYLNRLRGPALLDRGICVNDTDFYTLEPLNEIKTAYFYSYRDDLNFIYGFSITSLMILFKKKDKSICNPYNRECLNINIINNFLTVDILVGITCKRELENDNNIGGVITDNKTPRYHSTTGRNTRDTVISKLVEMRTKSTRFRIRDLFIEIDILGNYTHSSWFSNLDKPDCIQFFQYLHYIWYNSGMLNYQAKHYISPFFDPFIYGLNNHIHPTAENSTPEQCIEYCITLMENLVYGGIDIEHRKIGVLHMLSALTMVSSPARENMIWLYESFNQMFM